MEQEIEFHQTKAQLVSWEVRDTGLLHLRDADDNTVTRAWQIEDKRFLGEVNPGLD